MSGFKASEAVERLDYDFTDLQVSDPAQQEILAGAKGTIPEPSQQQLDGYFEAMRTLLSDLGVDLADAGSPQQLMAAFAKLPEGALERMNEGMVQAVADLCGGQPSRDQIAALPPRVRQAFVGWLSGQFANPTTLDMSSSAVASNGVASST